MGSNDRNEAVWAAVEAHAAAGVALSDAVWEVPELAYGEVRSAGLHAAALRAAGFRVREGVAGIATAVMGEAGEDGPVIAFLGEYDALPGLSQAAGVWRRAPVVEGGNGHACGHNLLGAGALLAAVGLTAWLEQTGVPGRVRYYGCPAEEGGAAKVFMVREGAFAGVDAGISWHPDAFFLVDKARSIATLVVDYAFHGRTAHAAVAPHLGRSAMDAVELTSIGVNYLREHMPADARVHSALQESGGKVANVVPAFARVRYQVRSAQVGDLLELVERVHDVARGAALMTGTRLEIRPVSGTANLLGNAVLEDAMQGVMEALGPVAFDEADLAAARAVQATLGEQDIRTDFARYGFEYRPGLALCDWVAPAGHPGEVSPGSTDLGDVSWTVPVVQARAATYAIGTPGHSWQFAAQGKSAHAHKGMVHAAKVMAATGAALIEDAALRGRARAEFEARLARTPYRAPMPPEARPGDQT